MDCSLALTSSQTIGDVSRVTKSGDDGGEKVVDSGGDVTESQERKR